MNNIRIYELDDAQLGPSHPFVKFARSEALLPSDLAPDISNGVILDHLGAVTLQDGQCMSSTCSFVCPDLEARALLMPSSCKTLLDARWNSIWEKFEASAWSGEAVARAGSSSIFTVRQAPHIRTDGEVSEQQNLSKTWAQDDVLHWELARKHELFGAGIKIVVVDTGLHPQGCGSISGARESGLKAIDGMPLAKMCNIASCEDEIWNSDMHGTAVAALIAGRQESPSLPAIGLAPACSLIPVMVSTASRDMPQGSLALALGIAASFKPDIIVTTFNCDEETPCLRRAVSLIQDRDILLLAAAGNLDFAHPRSSAVYPARRCGVVSVGAINSDLQIPNWSNMDKVDIVCPGVGIWAPWEVEGKHLTGNFWNGTSMATPLAAGVVAVVLEHLRRQNPGINITAVDAYRRLLRTMHHPDQPRDGERILTLVGMLD